MKKVIVLCLLMLPFIIFSQSEKKLPVIPISKWYKLGFKTYDKEFKMYQNPFILNGHKKYTIEGYGSMNYSDGKLLGISPNNRYIVLDHISKGYVEDGVNKQLYENYLCVIVDVHKKEVVMNMQSDCSGEWNKNNQWMSSGKAVFP
ncbi:hypothetical protein [Chryseobacterium jejuense]|uniref:WG repeat-containing protein n=1 Tax=Chryseobacterium jejuense TaxID=445960 RepID=A0A2X2Z7Q0_CHRJE|nr:hypothetical protein [Chryseobacterium jejuense]SDI13558.1 hypothetical protein SAMN05421542_0180 [Chryseobacterium jejuense]SQB46450.1 Uncharacterised protein [Chryseobacterium jejuense]